MRTSKEILSNPPRVYNAYYEATLEMI
jgi:hypothetical protein